MTQSPFQVDALQVDPGSGDVLTVDRDPTTHGLRLTDPAIPGGILLSQLASLNTVTGVLTVGRGGSGAGYSTLQAALNAVPSSSSATAPTVILMLPGVYTENVTWNKDGVTLVCLGRVVLQGTLTIIASVSTTPLAATIRGLVIVQSTGGQSCVVVTGGSGSTVGTNDILLDDCTLLPTGVGGYSVSATAINSLILRNCRTVGVPSSASMVVTQCASLQVYDGVLPALQVDFDSTGALPSVSVGSYQLQGCQAGNILSTLSGGGSLTLTGCPSVGNLTVSGNRTLTVRESTIGALTINGTTAATTRSTTRGTASGTGTLQESKIQGTAAVVATDTVAVEFAVSRPNSSYGVNLDAGLADQPWVTSKTVDGFTIHFSGSVSTTVTWTVFA